MQGSGRLRLSLRCFKLRYTRFLHLGSGISDCMEVSSLDLGVGWEFGCGAWDSGASVPTVGELAGQVAQLLVLVVQVEGSLLKSGYFRADNIIRICSIALLIVDGPCLDFFELRICLKAIIRDFSGSATIYYCHQLL